MENSAKAYLNVPEQTLSTLSFCEPNARQLNAWVSSLPMANIGETARQLYHAVIEFNQLRLTEQSRYEMLELIRNPIHYVCNALNRRYLTQSIVLDDSQRKIANLAQALQTHLAVGYRIIVESRSRDVNSKNRELIARSLHRCISDLAPSILRTYQLYLKTPPGIWHEIHSLYQIAASQNLSGYKLIDEQNQSDDPLSISSVYSRILLLGACQPNQLHQRDLSEIYNALETWIKRVRVDEIADERSTLIINPDGDAGPVYRHLLKPHSYSDHMGLNTSGLVRALNLALTPSEASTADAESPLKIPPSIGNQLLQHLVQSWGGMKQRAFSRSQSSGQVEVAIGLSAVHFRLSGRVGFHQQLYSRRSDNKFMGAPTAQFDAQDTMATRTRKDVWHDSFDANRVSMPGSIDVPPAEENEISDGKDFYPSYQAYMINTSPRGYCLGWQGALASNLQTGELVAIRESDAKRWNLGVIRWIRQAVKEGAQIGIELIAPNSQPCAIRLLNKTGQHGDYMRALLVPEIRSIGQPASILAPRIPFQVGHKVGINRQSHENKWQLIKKIQSTSSFNRFQIRTMEAKSVESPEDATSRVTEDNFESLWRQL